MLDKELTFSEKHLEFHKPIIVGGQPYKKLQNAINSLKESGDDEATVNLTFNELVIIRRLLVADDIAMRLMRDNVIEGKEYRKAKRDL